MNKLQFIFRFLIISLIAFLPIAETKASLIYGAFYNIPWYINFLFSFFGNILIIPFYFYLKFNLSQHKKNFFVLKIYKLFQQYKKKLAKKIIYMKKFSIIALILIIAIPISGSGTWSGVMIGELLNLNRKEIAISICIGSIISIFLSALFVYGVFNFKIFNFRSFL